MRPIALLVVLLLTVLAGCSEEGSATVETFEVGGSSSSSVTPAAGGSSSSRSTVPSSGGSSSGLVRIVSVGPMAPAQSTTIVTTIEFSNTSEQDLNLSEFRLRYWLSAELVGSATLVPEVDVGPALQRVTVCVSSPVRPGADHYIEIAFDGGSLLAASSVRLVFRTHKSDWTAFDQSDDYSYPAGLTAGTELATIGVYRNGVLVAGAEP